MTIETITIEETQFHINGKPTYAGRYYDQQPLEGMLFNSRMVQAIFDDSCPETVHHWKYPDTGVWDPDRNTEEFCKMLPGQFNFW